METNLDTFRREIQLQPVQCARCHASLRTLPADADQCPQCKSPLPRRCFQCGYELTGLPESGRCPECGEEHNLILSRWLQPWPSAGAICWRVTWPFVLGLIGGSMMLLAGELQALLVLCMGFTWLMFLVAPFNAYFSIRSLLRRHLPNQRRSGGMIAGLRTLGTLVFVLAVIVVVLPWIALGACLVLL